MRFPTALHTLCHHFYCSQHYSVRQVANINSIQDFPCLIHNNNDRNTSRNQDGLKDNQSKFCIFPRGTEATCIIALEFEPLGRFLKWNLFISVFSTV